MFPFNGWKTCPSTKFQSHFFSQFNLAESCSRLKTTQLSSKIITLSIYFISCSCFLYGANRQKTPGNHNIFPNEFFQISPSQQ